MSLRRALPAALALALAACGGPGEPADLPPTPTRDLGSRTAGASEPAALQGTPEGGAARSAREHQASQRAILEEQSRRGGPQTSGR